MINLNEIKSSINKIKLYSQELNDGLNTLKCNDNVSISLHISNLKRMSLQAFDLVNVMERQVNFIENKKITIVNNSFKNKGRKIYDLSMGR